MPAADLLITKAKEYEQLAAHNAEVAELGQADATAKELAATGYTLVAITLREVAYALTLDERGEDMAA